MKQWLNQTRALTAAAAVFFAVFILWLTLTYVPILVVEVRYQSHSFLKNVLHIESLAQLFIPNFEAFNLERNTRYRDFGIVIPAIGVNEPVVFNVDPNNKAAYTAALKKGIAHASGTAFPDNPGIGYYFAHSSSPEFRQQYNAIFYLLGKLKAGDQIYIWHENQPYAYVVKSYRITDPQDISFLHQTYERETIVLQTCWPPGTTRQRLMVFAERDQTTSN